MVLRWYCFIHILIQFVIWCKRTNFDDCHDAAEWIGGILGFTTALLAWVGTLYYVLFSQFI